MTSKPTQNGTKVTITDIANASKVSPATVSLVLRDKPGVGDETRQRVLETAQSLGYIPPSTPAKQADRESYKQIGLLMKVDPHTAPEQNQFYVPVVTGIESVCRQRRSYLLYANLPVDEHNQPLELPRLMTDNQIDGLLVIGMELTEGLLAHLQQSSVPIVLVDGYAADDPFDSVVTDNVRGGMQATEHLIGQGHQKIAIIGSAADAYPSILERRHGYIRAMQNHGLEPIFADCTLFPAQAEKAVEDLLVAHPDVSALFACNDEISIAIMKKLASMGKRVPEDISIIGFDNIVLAQHVTPALSTMRVDKMSMGRLAAQLMFNRLQYPKSSLVRTIIQPQLIVRESVQPY
ncbi:MAG: LacI family DNA-binding transcriptional regulator [Chloroflexota bacterium]